MNCNAIQESLVDLLEGNLSEKNRQEVEKHLQQCESCQEDWKKIQEVISMLDHESESIEVPNQFMKNVKHKVEFTQKKNKKLFKQRATMSLVAGLFLTFFVGSAFATNGFTSVKEWWQDVSQRENDKVQKNVQHGLAENLNLVSESNGVKMKITNVVADDIQTLIYYEIEDMSKENNYMIDSTDGVKIVNQAQILENNEEVGTPVRSHFKLYSDSQNVFKGRIAVAPMSMEKGKLQLVFNQLEKVATSESSNQNSKSIPYGQNQFLEGEWSFTIPVKKHASIVHDINMETEVEGNPVVIEKITFAPTATVLSYKFKNGNPKEVLNHIEIASLKANDKIYENDNIGLQTGYGGTSIDNGENSWHETEAIFDSLYLEQPKDIQLQFGAIISTVEERQVYSIDMTKNFPQTFDYRGNRISIEEVNLGNPTEILVKEEFAIDRNYQQLNVNFYDQDGHSSGGSSITGFYVDKDGATYKLEDYIYRLNELKQPRFFSTEHHIQMTSDTTKESIIPKRFEIEGYTNTAYTDKKVKITLK